MSDLIVPSRRSFLLGLGASLIAAPAIVRAASLMPVRVLRSEIDLVIFYERIMALYINRMSQAFADAIMHGQGNLEIPELGYRETIIGPYNDKMYDSPSLIGSFLNQKQL